MFTPIADIIPNSLKRAGVAELPPPRTLIEDFVRLAGSHLPETLRDGFKALHLRDRVLTVACRTSAAATALGSIRGQLMADLSREHPDEPVEKLRLLLSTWR